jgi:hypothetical protein
MLSLQMTLLCGGIATFCALVLWRAGPLCIWCEWAGACGEGAEDDAAPHDEPAR